MDNQKYALGHGRVRLSGRDVGSTGDVTVSWYDDRFEIVFETDEMSLDNVDMFFNGGRKDVTFQFISESPTGPRYDIFAEGSLEPDQFKVKSRTLSFEVDRDRTSDSTLEWQSLSFRMRCKRIEYDQQPT